MLLRQDVRLFPSEYLPGNVAAALCLLLCLLCVNSTGSGFVNKAMQASGSKVSLCCSLLIFQGLSGWVGLLVHGTHPFLIWLYYTMIPQKCQRFLWFFTNFVHIYKNLARRRIGLDTGEILQYNIFERGSFGAPLFFFPR